MTTDRPAVLFVCVKNGGKSQMAAALMRHQAAGAVEVLSAGTGHGSAINARSAEAVAEVGADMASAVPQPVTPELLRRVDQEIVIGGDAVIDPVEGMRAPVTTWRTRSVLRSPSRCAGTRVSPLSPAPASTRPAPHIARRHRSSSGSRPPTDVARTCAPLRSASPTQRQFDTQG